MSLTTLQKDKKLQSALHAKAKGSPNFRFYSLYDKICRKDVLKVAYGRCQSNGGSEGVDGQTFEDIEAYGQERWVDELAEELKRKECRCSAVRRVWIPTANGKQRPLGIPRIRDRVVQMAAVLMLEPIFEADLQPEQYAYRSGKSAHDAIRQVHSLLNTGHTEVIDADLSGYFNSIPHGELMKSVARRVSDKAMLHLIKRWLEAPVEETDERGNTRRTTRNRDEKRGTPQGAPISPLLSNLYMRRFVLGWKTLGHEKRLNAYIVNYADDFVICCRNRAASAMTSMREMREKLRLTVNEQKTRPCQVPDESFDFLGYTIGRCYSPKTGKVYIGMRPSKKKVVAMCRAIRRRLQQACGTMRQYRRASHCVYDLKYHIVWITKYRKPVLGREIGTRVRDLIRMICASLDVEIVKGNISRDHVHLLVSAPPTLAVSRLVQRMKGLRSRKLLMENRGLNKAFWGRHLWARGYFWPAQGT